MAPTLTVLPELKRLADRGRNVGFPSGGKPGLLGINAASPVARTEPSTLEAVTETVPPLISSCCCPTQDTTELTTFRSV